MPFFIVASCALIYFPTRNYEPAKEAWKVLLPPPPNIENLVFGYNEVVADVFWLRLIQSFDYCDRDTTDQIKTTILPDGRVQRVMPACHTQRGWVYRMLSAIIKLAPRNYIPYRFGGLFLSVIISDYEGASDIYDKAIKQFPNDWQLRYFAAEHFMNNVKDDARAADLLLEAGQMGAPKWVLSLAAKIYTAQGKALFAKSVLESELKENPEGDYADRLKERLAQVNAEFEKTAAEKQ